MATIEVAVALLHSPIRRGGHSHAARRRVGPGRLAALVGLPSCGYHSGSATPCHKTVTGDASVRQDGPAPRCLGRKVGPVPRGAHGVGRLAPWWRQPSFQRPTASPVVAARPPAPGHFLLRPLRRGDGLLALPYASLLENWNCFDALEVTQQRMSSTSRAVLQPTVRSTRGVRSPSRGVGTSTPVLSDLPSARYTLKRNESGVIGRR
jgi:hypothetical protein